MRQKLSIKRVNNGFIVTVIKHDDIVDPDYYELPKHEKDIYVFETEMELNTFLSSFWAGAVGSHRTKPNVEEA